MSAVTISDISKTFDGKFAVKEINLDLREGEVLGIVGPSGSGKTTLLRLVSLLIHPDSGSITIQGVDAKGNEEHRRRLRTQTAMVFQYSALFDTSIFNNVALGLKIRRFDKREIKTRVRDMLGLVKLSGLEKRRANTLSGGEAQRVALARALVVQPKVLLLDEATANLDPKNVEIIEGLVRRANVESKTSVIVATHNLNQARRLATRIAFLLDGDLVEVGDTTEIYENPKDERTAAFMAGRMVW
jgi:tungstate transport system ATP-binding protein